MYGLNKELDGYYVLYTTSTLKIYPEFEFAP